MVARSSFGRVSLRDCMIGSVTQDQRERTTARRGRSSDFRPDGLVFGVIVEEEMHDIIPADHDCEWIRTVAI